MNIVFVSHNYYPCVGGLERAIDHISAHILKSGHRITIVSSDAIVTFHEGNTVRRVLPRKETIKGIPVQRFCFAPRWISARIPELVKRMTRNICVLFAMYRFLRKQKVDVVHLHNLYIPTAHVLFLSYLMKFKLVVTLHGYNVVEIPFRPLEEKLVFKHILRRADYVTACSASTLLHAQEAVPEIRDKSSVIYNGVDPSEFLHTRMYDHPRPYILSLANLHFHKGIDILIMAFARIAGKYRDFDLILVGDGEKRDDCEGLVKALGLESRVVFLGQTEDRKKVVELLNGSEFLVLASRYEPFGIVLLEAMAAGKAIVATRSGGIPEIVNDGVTGILVEPKNDQSLADGMVRLIENKELRDTLGHNGRNVARAYQWDTFGDAYCAVYKKVMNA